MPTEEYAVVRETGSQGYKFSTFHESLDIARAEAERLASKEKAKFIVLKVVGFAEPKPQPAVWTAC